MMKFKAPIDYAKRPQPMRDTRSNNWAWALVVMIVFFSLLNLVMG